MFSLRRPYKLRILHSSVAVSASNLVKNFLLTPIEKRELTRLEKSLSTWKMPRHVGLILDGNRRFAREMGMADVVKGHELGADKLYEVLNWIYDTGIEIVTVWIFSIDNFNRHSDEVERLLRLIAHKTDELTTHPDVHQNELKVRYIGRTDLLPDYLQDAIASAENATAHYSRHTLNVAIAYGGREEITDAFKRYLQAHSGNGKSIADLAETFSEDSISLHTYTAGQPDPDLIIRTSGEVRLSGFMLWQSAYSEYYFCDSYWPGFRKLDFLRALHEYNQRQRRFGR